MPSLDAIIGVEGVYYNPAGLVKLNNGLYISLNNQYVTQKRTIESTFPMNQQKFEGDVLAPLFPTFYAVYKKDKLAYSFGVNPIGGGGSANFTKGLPSFEQPVAAFNIPLLLTASGIPTSNYGLEASLDGSSLNWGFQANVSYAINDMISVSLGLRYIVANNSYKGGLKIHKSNAPFKPKRSG
jgi:long-subunit fatty acid transport protein